MKKRLFSRLTLKIFAVNFMALVVLALGLIYLGKYETNLIETELKSLERQGFVYAGAIAEAAQIHGPMLFRGENGSRILMYDRLSRFPARKMIRRLSQTAFSRIRLYDHNAVLVGDSKKLWGPTDFISLPDPKGRRAHFLTMPFKTSLDFILDILPSSLKLAQYPDKEGGGKIGYVYPEVTHALQGQPASTAWWDDGKLILTTAVPVENPKTVMGVVYLTRDGTPVLNGIKQVQRDVIAVFLGALGFTFLLTLYLSGAIARPIRKLSRAAKHVQEGKSRHDARIPDLSRRNDEIGDLSVSLNNMTEELFNRLDSIERFAADVSHELKNPLTSLRSAVETVGVIQSTEDRNRLLNVITHDVDRLDRLITDISKASRLDAELSREDISRVDIKTLLEGLISHYTIANKYKVAIHIHCPEKPKDIFVLGRDNRLGQVFDNLLSNALSFSNEGDEIIFDITKDGSNWIITVKDQGPGIPDGKLETIFDRFYTERPSSEAFGQHSGLGLSICKQIIEAHNGQIFAKNCRDDNGHVTGACFTVVLKAA